MSQTLKQRMILKRRKGISPVEFTAGIFIGTGIVLLIAFVLMAI